MKEKKEKEKLEYFFPEYESREAVVVYADSIEEATKIYNSMKKDYDRTQH